MSDQTSGKSFLIFGGTGLAGGLVAQGLLERGESVRCLVRDASKAAALKEAGAEIVVGDLDDPSSLAPAFEGIDSVFLVTAVSPNVLQQVRNGVQAAKDAGVSHFVRYTPGMATEDDRIPVAKAHALGEKEVAASGLPYTIVKSHNYMQGQLANAASIQSDGVIYSPLSDVRIGMMDLRDAAEASIEILVSGGHTGQSYFITGPAAITIDEVAAAVSKAIGRDVSHVGVPMEATREALLGMGIDPWVVDQYIGYFTEFRNGYGDVVTDDFTKVTGRQSRTIDDFARDFAGVFNPELAAAAK